MAYKIKSALKLKCGYLLFSLIATFYSLYFNEVVFADQPAAQPLVGVITRKIEDTNEDRFRLGFGAAFFGNYSSSQEIPSLSLMFDLNAIHSLQWTFGIGNVSPNFNFGTGLVYRMTISGDRTLGLHTGFLGNVGIAREGSLVCRLGPVLGIHFALFQYDRLQLSLEAGPTFNYNNGSNFQMRSIGGAAGANIHYFF